MTTCILIYSCTIYFRFMRGKELGYTDCSLAITSSQMEQPLNYRHTKLTDTSEMGVKHFYKMLECQSQKIKKTTDKRKQQGVMLPLSMSCLDIYTALRFCTDLSSLYMKIF